jgi:hypothetical protein
MNGSAYRPPTRRGPIDNNNNANAAAASGQGQGQNGAAGLKRPPLGDVSNMHYPSNAGAQGNGLGDDAKRQRVAGPENIGSGPPPQQSLPGSR